MFQAGDVVREVIQEAVNQLDSGNPCVLATVVRTKGSTPQKAGAMLLVREDGTAVGTLGGGCVEGDIWFAAREILRNQGGPEFKDYYLNEDIAARDGLVCGGTMYFYLEPYWDADDFSDIGNELIALTMGRNRPPWRPWCVPREIRRRWAPSCCSAPTAPWPAASEPPNWTKWRWKSLPVLPP